MDNSNRVTWEHAKELLDAVFQEEGVAVYNSYTYGDSGVHQYKNADEVIEAFRADTREWAYLMVAVYYEEAAGYLRIERLEITDAEDPYKVKFNLSGWGLIHVHLERRKDEFVDLWVGANSEGRAHYWSAVPNKLGDPALWNWRIIEKKYGRLLRLRRKFIKQTNALVASREEPAKS